MTNDEFSWLYAVGAASIRYLSGEERNGGWPVRLTPSNLAAFQFPCDRARSRALERALVSLIEGGRLPATACSEYVFLLYGRREFGPREGAPPAGMRQIARELGTDAPHRVAQYLVGRDAFRDFLRQQNISPSEHITAWLRPLEEAGKVPARAKRETQADRIEGLLKEIERRASEKGAPFDRQAMPGTKADLLALAHAWDPALRTLRTVESLNRYLKGRCTWPADAGARKSALPLFAELFPEARIFPARAVSPQRKAS